MVNALENIAYVIGELPGATVATLVAVVLCVDAGDKVVGTVLDGQRPSALKQNIPLGHWESTAAGHGYKPTQ